MEQRTAPERIDELRKEIDRIDKELIALFERRMDTACAIGCIKRENSIAIKNEGREEQVKANCRENCSNSLYLPYAQSVMMSVIEACRGVQDSDASRQEAASET